MRTVYKTDGTNIGFFTAVFDAYTDKEAVILSSSYQAMLGEKTIEVFPDERKAARVLRKIRALDSYAQTEIDYVLRTPYSDREQIAFLYVKRLVRTGAPVRGNLSVAEIAKAVDYAKKTSCEAHRTLGFLRFHETAQGFYYAAMYADNDILDLVMPHFVARLKNIPFVIHDVNRKKAGLSDGKRTIITEAAQADVLFSDSEDEFVRLWKKYYKTVTITERKNEKLMNGYMPVRYRAFMPEKEESFSSKNPLE